MGFLQGFYGKPRVDLALLRQHSEGLIALSACLAGEIPRRLRAGDYDGAKAYALELSGIPLHAEDRTWEDPGVIGGGPCSYNPEPIAVFFDMFYIGE